MFSFWNWNCHTINFNFPTNQKCPRYFHLIWSFVVIFVIAWGSTYSLSKFSRLHYKSFKSLDHNVHSVWHVKCGNMNITPQGENVKLLVQGDQFQPQTQEIYRFHWNLGRNPTATESMAKHLSLSVLLGKKPHGFPWLWRTQAWKWPLETWVSLGKTWKESKLRDAWCGSVVIIRLWRGRVVQRPELCVGRLFWGKEAGGLRKSQGPPFWPWFVYLLKLKHSGFMDRCNISPLSSFPAPTVSDFSKSVVWCFPNVLFIF